jgi:hypothetical protein
LVQSAHAPDPPHAVWPLPLVQWPPEQQLPPAQLPLPKTPQASVHMPEVQVGVPPLQPIQAVPFDPQAVLLLPPTQVPVDMPAGMLQQPPLHGFAAEQEVVHWCVTVLHVEVGPQSFDPLQPQ